MKTIGRAVSMRQITSFIFLVIVLAIIIKNIGFLLTEVKRKQSFFASNFLVQLCPSVLTVDVIVDGTPRFAKTFVRFVRIVAVSGMSLLSVLSTRKPLFVFRVKPKVFWSFIYLKGLKSRTLFVWGLDMTVKMCSIPKQDFKEVKPISSTTTLNFLSRLDAANAESSVHVQEFTNLGFPSRHKPNKGNLV